MHLARSIRPALIALAALSLISFDTAQAQRTRPAPARRARPRSAAPATTKPAAPAKTAATAPTASASTVNLSAEDVRLLVNNLELPQQARAELASNAATRKDLLKDLREMFALAAEARSAGFDARPDVRVQLDLSRAFVVAQAYRRRQSATNSAAPAAQAATAEEVDAFLKEAGQEAKFAEFVQDYVKNRPSAQPNAELTAEQRGELRGMWANVMLGARKGAAAGLDKDRAVQLMVAYQHARLLAGGYFRETLASRVQATEAEIDAYFAAHPELDPAKSRAKAEGIRQRAAAGEDFAKLANEFTEDPSGKGSGGDLGWFGQGMMVKPFEEAAFALKPGEVSPVVETPFGFHVIKLEERRAKAGNSAGGAEEVRARHILITPPQPPGDRARRPGTPPREAARAAVEDAKRTKLIEEIAARSRVTVAADFSLDAPAAMPATPSKP